MSVMLMKRLDDVIYAGKRKIGSQMIVAIVVAAVVSVMLSGLGTYFLRKRARKSVQAILRKNCMLLITKEEIKTNPYFFY